MNNQLRKFVKENIQQDFDIVTSISGIGKTTAEKFLFEIVDISKFNSHNQLRAYIGTDPSIKQSGSSIIILWLVLIISHLKFFMTQPPIITFILFWSFFSSFHI